MSKGSKPRPYSVINEVFSNNFDSIFPRDSAKQSPLETAGYESCKESDTDRTDAAKNRALVNR